MSSSVRITESFTALLEGAILRGFSYDKTGISYDKSPDSRYLNFPDFEMWPTKPRFHVLEGCSACPPFLNRVYSL